MGSSSVPEESMELMGRADTYVNTLGPQMYSSGSAWTNRRRFAEYIRAQSFSRFPRAALSRGLSGARGSALVINLPGSTSGVTDALAALEPIIDHAIDVLGGRNSHS